MTQYSSPNYSKRKYFGLHPALGANIRAQSEKWNWVVCNPYTWSYMSDQATLTLNSIPDIRARTHFSHTEPCSGSGPVKLVMEI